MAQMLAFQVPCAPCPREDGRARGAPPRTAVIYWLHSGCQCLAWLSLSSAVIFIISIQHCATSCTVLGCEPTCLRWDRCSQQQRPRDVTQVALLCIRLCLQLMPTQCNRRAD